MNGRTSEGVTFESLQNTNDAFDRMVKLASLLGKDISEFHDAKEVFDGGKLTRREFYTAMVLQQNLNLSVIEALSGVRLGKPEEIDAGTRAAVKDVRALYEFASSFSKQYLSRQEEALDVIRSASERLQAEAKDRNQGG